MKIANVTPGLIQIPPNGWGAIEKIIWEQHVNIQKQGHESVIVYLDEIPKDVDIVHIHVANLANIAHQRGIPYYFTMHDHHTVLYGKDSAVYKENLLAIQNAVKAFVPAKYLVDYFDGIPEYVSHGVNCETFNPGKVELGGSIKYLTKNVTSHKLLCVANNGYANDSTKDRKGFSLAIDAAKKLGLPITIAGPINNKNYFDNNPVTYENLTVLYDLTEEQLIRLYKQHSIFVSPSELEAGHPNLTLLEALASGLPVVSTFESNDAPNGIRVVDRNESSIITGITDVLENYAYYSYIARKQAEELDWSNITKQMIVAYKQKQPEKTLTKILSKEYNTTVPLKLSPKSIKETTEPQIGYSNLDGMRVDIVGGPSTEYRVVFVDKNTSREVYSTILPANSWAKTSAKYYVDWKVYIEDVNSNKTYEYDLDLSNKKVHIILDSKSMGDTLAWMPYVEEFRKKHGCKVVCSTFWNFWFDGQYPDIEFVSPGQQQPDTFARYVVGVFYNDNKIDFDMHPIDPLPYSMQKYATDILGLPYVEIKPKINQPTDVKKKKQVSIAIHSTAQTKYWNNPTGWQEVVDWLNSKGYVVRLLSKEEDGFMGNKHPTGVVHKINPSIEETLVELKQSEFFIGIGSGLTWLSWALDVPTVLISGFSDPITEMQECIRIVPPPRTCANCWNRHKFDRGDWNWCPDFKNTFRQFECTKQITGRMVIDTLKQSFNI